MFRISRKNICRNSLVILRGKSTKYNGFPYLSNILSVMPLENKNKVEANVAYNKRQEKLTKFSLSNPQTQIEVLGNGAHGAPRSVYLCSGSVRYLFNCGEGSQRLATEYKIKLTRTPHVFITYSSWENISGLLGVALSLQSIGVPELCIHGPQQIESIFSATNKFVAIRSIFLKVMDCMSTSEFKDSVLNVKYVPLFSSRNESLKDQPSNSDVTAPGTSNNESNSDFDNLNDDIDYYAHLRTGKQNENYLVKQKSYSDSNKKNATEKFAIAYICHTKKTFGTLLPDKCVKLGVPIGPLFGKLKRGETITLNDGTVIKSSDVKTPDIPGAFIIVVECPSEDFLESLLNEPAFTRHQSGDSDEIAEVVIHFTKSEIVNNSKYIEWMNRFPKQTKHLFINEDNSFGGSVGVQRLQYKLNMLHPEIFPLLTNSAIPTYPRVEESVTPEAHTVVHVEKKNEEKASNYDFLNDQNITYKDKIYFKCGNNPIIRGETLSELYVRPFYEYDYSNCLVLKKDLFLNEIFSIPGFEEELKRLQSELQHTKLTDEHYPKILFLGTGSCQPNKLRNTSGILVFVDEKTPILLDCGEGTYGQLIQFFGKEKGRDILRNLNVIYVSHLHTDHHIGLVTILKQRKLAHDEKVASSMGQSNSEACKLQPVLLVCPIQLSRWLNLYSREFENISSLYTILACAHLMDNLLLKEKYEKCLSILNLKEMKTTLVDHCPNAFGVAMVHRDGWKLTYSGDTRPCQKLVEIGMNSDILIHEATMDDSMKIHAAQKLHSTTSQAIKIGKNMNARFILLTHFSQRYSHIPLFNDNFTEEVGIAFDNMIVSLNQLPILSKLKPALKLMFFSQYEEMEEKIKSNMLKKRKRKISITDEKIPVKQINFNSI